MCGCLGRWQSVRPCSFSGGVKPSIWDTHWKTHWEVHKRARGGFQLQLREEKYTVECLCEGLLLLQCSYFNIKALGSPQNNTVLTKSPPTDCSLVCFRCISGITERYASNIMIHQTRSLQYILMARSINQRPTPSQLWFNKNRFWKRKLNLWRTYTINSSCVGTVSSG